MARPNVGSIDVKDGRLRVRISAGTDPVTGKRHYRVEYEPGTGANARKRAIQRMNRMRREELEHRSQDGFDPTEATVGQLLTQWLEIAGAAMSPNTVVTNRYNMEHYLSPLLDVPCADLTLQVIEQHYTTLWKVGIGADPKPLSPHTIQRAHGTLRRALQYGVRWGWIPTNPALNAEPPVVSRVERRMPTEADLRAFLDYWNTWDPDFTIWVRLAATTGARRGEICALRWSDVDFDAGTITIRRAAGVGSSNGREETFVRESTKTQRSRRIAVGTTTLEGLRRFRRECEERALACGVTLRDGFVFAEEPDGATPWRPPRATHRFMRGRKALVEAGHPVADVRLGDLRHYVASSLLQSGESVTAVSERLGNSPNTLLSNYAHFIPANDRAAAQRLDDGLGGG